MTTTSNLYFRNGVRKFAVVITDGRCSGHYRPQLAANAKALQQIAQVWSYGIGIDVFKPELIEISSLLGAGPGGAAYPAAGTRQEYDRIRCNQPGGPMCGDFGTSYIDAMNHPEWTLQ